MSNRNLKTYPLSQNENLEFCLGKMSMDVTPQKKLGYDTKENSKAVLRHRSNLLLNCLTSLTSPHMSKKRIKLLFLLWFWSIFLFCSELAFFFSQVFHRDMLQSWDRWDFELTLPLLSEGLNFEKIEKKSLRTAGNIYWFFRFSEG